MFTTFGSVANHFFSPSITQGGFSKVTLITLVLLNLAPRLLWKEILGLKHLANPAPHPHLMMKITGKFQQSKTKSILIFKEDKELPESAEILPRYK